jgi:exosortase
MKSSALSANWRHGSTFSTALFAIFLTASAPIFWPSLALLIRRSAGSADLSYLLMIPFIAVALLGLERKKIFEETRPNLRAGVAVVLASTTLYFILRQYPRAVDPRHRLTLEILAVALVWIGGFLLCYGAKAIRSGAFCVLFLLLTVPPPPPLMDHIILFLQRGSVVTCDGLFRLAGVPALREGNAFYVSNMGIEVATECSGIHAFTALVITALLVGHFQLRSLRRKLLLLILIVPLAILKNGLRIFALTVLGAYVDPAYLNGSFHHYGGIPLFGLSVLAVLLLTRWLRKSEPSRRANSIVEGRPYIMNDEGTFEQIGQRDTRFVEARVLHRPGFWVGVLLAAVAMAFSSAVPAPAQATLTSDSQTMLRQKPKPKPKPRPVPEAGSLLLLGTSLLSLGSAVVLGQLRRRRNFH